MITASQCRAARALTDVSRAILADQSGVSEDVIREFENKLSKPDDATINALQAALESLGALFIAENGGGIGVRLKFTRSEARRIAQMENEGGPTAFDEVP
ncbi:XRE family transcriptional regulator [Rhizobium sp. KVB221]|uniref:XRE family transcriptional regulator n=1 Tax=Rhizobium setariae TaxID=2801340 RepID=A0A936YQS2_9HYPH|nr:XRE family transcriptional regulator [Rhizobium setariae]MBL0370650.1 XRE family transcriptional regulator [Rhizobium setariae]